MRKLKWILLSIMGIALLTTPVHAVFLEDPNSGRKMTIDSENRGEVSAVIQSELEHESESNSQAYNWSTGNVSTFLAGAGATVLLLKNTSDNDLHIEFVIVDGGGVSTEYTLHLPTSEVTVTGTTVTGTNLNTGGKINVADAVAASNETNNVQGNIIGTKFVDVFRSATFNTEGIILGKNKSIAIDAVSGVTNTSVTIIGHYED